jgi:hypothetical protein
MKLTGEQILGAQRSFGTSGAILATNAATGETMEPPFGGGTAVDLDTAYTLAEAAFDSYRSVPLERRALSRGVSANLNWFSLYFGEEQPKMLGGRKLR